MLSDAKPSKTVRYGKNLLSYEPIPSLRPAVALPAAMANTIDLR